MTMRPFEDGRPEKVAVQLRLPDIVTEPSAQSASPVQPANTEPAAAVAVSFTAVALG
jgi:hypothetical protein